MRARDNPFRTERLQQLAFRPREASIDGLWDRLVALGLRGAIVGPHGSGKTTLLREVADRLEDRGLRVVRRFLNAESPAPRVMPLLREARRLGPGDALLFDGAGHLPRPVFWSLRRAARRAGALVVTAHRPGLLPTWIATATDAALLDSLARELIGDRARALAPLLEGLRREHGGNLRDVFLALYDLAAHDDARLTSSERGPGPVRGAPPGC